MSGQTVAGRGSIGFGSAALMLALLLGGAEEASAQVRPVYDNIARSTTLAVKRLDPFGGVPVIRVERISGFDLYGAESITFGNITYPRLTGRGPWRRLPPIGSELYPNALLRINRTVLGAPGGDALRFRGPFDLKKEYGELGP